MKTSARSKHFFGLMVFLGLSAALPAQAQFTFIKIAEPGTADPSGGAFLAFTGNPSLSNGQVGFAGYNGSLQAGLYLYSAGTLTTIVDFNTPVPGGGGSKFTGLAYDPILSNGKAAFAGDDGMGLSGIYTNAGGPLTAIVDTNTPVPGGVGAFSGFNNPAFSNDKTAFVGVDASQQQGLYTNAGGTLTKIADTNTPIPRGAGNFSGFLNPTISNGNVAFVDSGSSRGVHLYANGTLTTLVAPGDAAPDGGAFTTVDAASISNNEVAFAGTTTTQNGLYLYANGTLTTLADQNTPAPGSQLNFGSFGNPSLSNGNVAFQANDASGNSGVYMDLNGRVSKVLGFRDTLDGKIVGSVGSPSLDGNQIALYVNFLDNSSAIYLVSPAAATPAPDALVTALLGAVPGVGLLLRRRRACRS